MTTSSRLVPLALSLGGAVALWHGVSGRVRVPFEYAATLRRWRIHFRNINPREGRDGTGRFTVRTVSLEVSAGGTNPAARPDPFDGDLTGSGRGVATAWQSTPIPAGVGHLLSYTWSSTEPPKRVVGGGWSAHGPDGEFEPTQHHPLDTWIEAEVDATTPVFAVLNDSIASGVGAAVPVADSWPSAYGRRVGALPMHYTASGDTMKGWYDPNHVKWQRWKGLTHPDFAIHAMGLNDINLGTPIWELQARHLRTRAIIADLLTDKIYTGTITPITRGDDSRLLTRRAYNAWLTCRDPEIIGFNRAVSADDRRLSPGFDTDGTHMNAAGYRRMSGEVPMAWADAHRGLTIAASGGTRHGHAISPSPLSKEGRWGTHPPPPQGRPTVSTRQRDRRAHCAHSQRSLTFARPRTCRRVP
ncbi:SGNH/GDSL hydrolase family protein [Brachybacterium hainanense]|uniref:SGNH/GDSL hydrolase family protein n=1 Tax=Brachybacterium hainanense TaxID=1541174 RepID=A0ABV6RII9_9MICO